MATVTTGRAAAENGAYRLGILYVILATFAWSLGGLFAKLVTVDTFTTLYWRGTFGALSLFVVLLLRDRHRAWIDLGNLGTGGWLYAISSAIGMGCYLSSINYTSIAHNSIIWALVPLVTALAGWLLLREWIGLPTIVASLLALCGVAVMLLGDTGEGDAFGNFLAVLMMLSGVSMILITRRYRGLPVMAASLVASLLSAIIALPFASPGEATLSDLGVLLTFGIFQGAIGMVLFAMGARLIPAADSALISAAEAPLGPLWVLLILGIMPLPATILGGAIVLVAVIGHILIENRRAASAVTAMRPADEDGDHSSDHDSHPADRRGSGRPGDDRLSRAGWVSDGTPARAGGAHDRDVRPPRPRRGG